MRYYAQVKEPTKKRKCSCLYLVKILSAINPLGSNILHRWENCWSEMMVIWRKSISIGNFFCKAMLLILSKPLARTTKAWKRRQMYDFAKYTCNMSHKKNINTTPKTKWNLLGTWCRCNLEQLLFDSSLTVFVVCKTKQTIRLSRTKAPYWHLGVLSDLNIQIFSHKIFNAISKNILW